MDVRTDVMDVIELTSWMTESAIFTWSFCSTSDGSVWSSAVAQWSTLLDILTELWNIVRRCKGCRESPPSWPPTSTLGLRLGRLWQPRLFISALTPGIAGDEKCTCAAIEYLTTWPVWESWSLPPCWCFGLYVIAIASQCNQENRHF